MEKKQFVNQLKTKEEVGSVFLVKHIALMEGRDGRSYLNVILSDSTGDLESRKWAHGEGVAKEIFRGDYVFVRGKINLFQNRSQLIIQEINKISPDEINKEDFLTTSSTAPEKMFEELVAIVESMEDVYLKVLVKNIIFDPEIERRLKSWPAGRSIHHPYAGGLLEHLLSCTRLGNHLAPFYNLNRNFVIAGTALHDLGKIYELSDGELVDYTEEGKLIGHLLKGLEVVDRFSMKIPNFPANTRMHLKHILAAHHGEYDCGSPKIPHTTEAYLVYLIDLLDSKINSMEWAKRMDNTPGNWTNFNKSLERLIYKGQLPVYTEFNTVEAPEDRENVPRPPTAPEPTGRPKVSGKPFANLLKDLQVNPDSDPDKD
ncbi:MAG: HD domain-containing protein [Pseudomonadota bacterium]